MTTHNMIMKEEYPSGAKRWLCPTCEREIILQQHPKTISIDLRAGDLTVGHACFEGGAEALELEFDVNAASYSDELWQDAINDIFNEDQE